LYYLNLTYSFNRALVTGLLVLSAEGVINFPINTSLDYSDIAYSR